MLLFYKRGIIINFSVCSENEGTHKSHGYLQDFSLFYMVQLIVLTNFIPVYLPLYLCAKRGKLKKQELKKPHKLTVVSL